MAYTITKGTKFLYSFKCRQSQVKAIDKILTDNGYKTIKMVRMPFDNWYEYRVTCCIKSAYILIGLLKHFNTYE